MVKGNTERLRFFCVILSEVEGRPCPYPWQLNGGTPKFNRRAR